MPKIITTTALNLIQQQTGTEPYYVVSINWGTGSLQYFSTRIDDKRSDFLVNILEVGTVQNRKNSDSRANVATVRVTFSDLDGLMKFSIDNRNVEGAPANLFLAFAGSSQGDWVPLVVGKTAGPIVWNESNRTFECSIETDLESENLGYSATLDDFSDMNPEAEGVPWPIMFGSCTHVPALHFKRRASTYLSTAIRLYLKPVYELTDSDRNITMRGNPNVLAYTDVLPEFNVIYVEDSTSFPRDTNISIKIEDVIFSGTFIDDHKFLVTGSNDPKYADLDVGSRVTDDDDEQNYYVLWLDVFTPIVNHHCYFKAPSGNEWSNFCVRQEGTKCWFRFPFVSPQSPTNAVLMTSGYKIIEVYGITKCGMVDDVAGAMNQLKIGLGYRKVTAGQSPYGLLRKTLDDAADRAGNWWSAPPDAEVRLWNPPSQDIYIASLVKLDSVQFVYGKRKVNVGGKTRTVFAIIPDSYYTVENGLFPITGQIPTGIVFSQALCDYAGQGWEDDIYVTGVSTIGPNPCDIIQWLLLNYTDIKFYVPSFEAVRSSLVNTPANFALFDKRDALKVAQEIAYQARCALIFDLGGVAIEFLPSSNGPWGNYTEDNVKNVVLNYTETKEVKTRFVASFAPTYKDDHHLDRSKELDIRKFERILKSLVPSNIRRRSETQYITVYNNVNKYGVKTQEESAYIFNTYNAVLSFAEFWGFRQSNVWRTIQFDTWLPGTFLQPFDVILLNLALLNQINVPAVVDSVSFDPKTRVTTIQATIPIRVGEGSIAAGFWPGP